MRKPNSQNILFIVKFDEHKMAWVVLIHTTYIDVTHLHQISIVVLDFLADTPFHETNKLSTEMVV